MNADMDSVEACALRLRDLAAELAADEADRPRRKRLADYWYASLLATDPAEKARLFALSQGGK